jgi:predicted anti-sigma-YlaC factor YlaD
MRMRPILPADCARACQQLSLRLDSELSEFEHVLLEAHLSRCADCRAFEQSITDLTEGLRAVPLERPSISFNVQRTRTRMDDLLAGAFRAGSVAAALAVVALSGLVALHGSDGGGTGVNLNRTRVLLEFHERQLQQLNSTGQSTQAVPRGLAAAETVAMPGAAQAGGATQRAQPASSSRRLQGRR